MKREAAMETCHEDLVADDRRCLVHPFTDLARHRECGPSQILVRGEGIYQFDDQGRRYLDGLAGLWCVGLGYSEPRLVEAARAQLATLPFAHTFMQRSLPGVLHTTAPHFWRDGLPGESPEAYASRLAQELERLILAEDPKTIGAFFAEPLMGAGGVLLPPATYFEKIQEVLLRHDILFVVDEVITGFGRTGAMWGSQTWELQPDLLLCAKQLSSAYFPIGAVLVSARVQQALVEGSRRLGVFGMGNTMGGHPVGAAVALDVLRIYQERNLLAHICDVAPHLQERLQALADHPLVGQARGVGLVGGLEIVADKVSKTCFPPARRANQEVASQAMSLGLIVRPILGDTVAICPPLIISHRQVDELFDMMKAALDAALGKLNPGRA